MQRIDLNGNWSLRYCDPGEGQRLGWSQGETWGSGFIAARVPGDAHRALISAGRIPDPFYDRNESECAWMEEREWWYRLRFDGPPEKLRADERLRLIFHGLDTFATI